MKKMEEKALIKKEEVPNLFPVAKALFTSGIFPNVKNEYGAFAVVQYGHELGIGPMTALQSMSIVQGKICMSGQMMLSIALRNGVTYQIKEHTNTKCQILFKGSNIEFLSSFTVEEAKQAGIWKSQGGWEKYPQDMLFWRTVTRGLRRVCPDAILGLYAKEELEDAPLFEATIVENGETKVGEKAKEGKTEEAPPPSPPLDPEVSGNYLKEVLKHMDGYTNIFNLKNGFDKHKAEWRKNLTADDFQKVIVKKDAMKNKFEEGK
jgi:hypothetical protein